MELRVRRSIERLLPVLLFPAAVLLSSGCSDSGTDDDGAISILYDFEEDDEGWTGGFADYSTANSEDDLDLSFARRALPSGIMPPQQNGLQLTGTNLSDDLFMFAKQRVSGLRPNTSYRIVFDLSIASNAPSGCAGVGGSPGESVFVKVGAAAAEPVAVVEGDHYRLSVDKGNQSEGGANAVVVGDLANTLTTCTDTPFRLITRHNRDEPVVQTSDADGELWIFVGIDSGFEGTTEVYFNSIQVTLTPGA